MGERSGGRFCRLFVLKANKDAVGRKVGVADVSESCSVPWEWRYGANSTCAAAGASSRRWDSSSCTPDTWHLKCSKTFTLHPTV